MKRIATQTEGNEKSRKASGYRRSGFETIFRLTRSHHKPITCSGFGSGSCRLFAKVVRLDLTETL
jgi:hypothetical protein